MNGTGGIIGGPTGPRGMKGATGVSGSSCKVVGATGHDWKAPLWTSTSRVDPVLIEDNPILLEESWIKKLFNRKNTK